MMRHATLLLPILLLATAGGDLAAAPASLTTPLGGDALIVERFQGSEEISSLYSMTVDFAAARGREVPFDALLGQDVTLTVPLPDGTVRYFNGICSRVSQGDVDLRAHYQLTLVPRLWLLTRRQTSRIFQDESVPRIVAQVLGSVPGLAFEMQLAGTYPPRNYVVQRNESDFAFVSRLLEDEGIAYYFRHDAGGHIMVLADTPEGFADLPGAHPYRPVSLLPAVGSILSWAKTQEIRTGKVTLRDYSFETPGDHHEVQATIQETVLAGPVEHHLTVGGGDALERYDFPGRYAQRFDGIAPGGEMRPEEVAKIDAEGRRVAASRIQEEATHALVVNGSSVAPDLKAGHIVTISGVSAPFTGDYLVTRVTHRLNQSGSLSGGYRNEFTGIPAGLPYRPPRVTPKPVMPGMETAVVVAPPGEEILTDKYGRVKVKFHWDRTGREEGGGSTSCWVRVASPWAGAGTGVGSGPLILPRVGWEVVVAFLDGDPDQPIIVGSVYNADHLPPPPER